MFPKMRRIKQQLDNSEVLDILKSNTTCTLALIGENGYPYSLPISYCYDEGNIYFHCAKVGHKIDCIKNCDSISLSVIEHDEIIEEKFTDKYKSVVVFGKVEIIDDEKEIRRLCRKMFAALCPNVSDGIEKEIEQFIEQTAVVKITIEHMTGKEGLEFLKEREQ
ncbi:pyridoxamine 5'-phosphate oxidase family protein [Eubacterium sp.]|uniref:pyridoxamine 5'-phosphate oxidase family protein n=1 Tax=Eubacterium sp. TaxID=142586 RepID=UPI0025C465BC|nr:pyridoxamine 5'-phosphate oxidase family protein [Eubacterium sp.]MCI7801039.1 pyridoxamine 5'-phosphate oxidase family protein [Eubacterium sp.]